MSRYVIIDKNTKVFNTLGEAERTAGEDQQVVQYLPEREYSCNDIGEMKQVVSDLHMSFLFSFEHAGICPKAEHLTVVAFAHLSIVSQTLSLAEIEQAAAMAARR